MDLKIPFQNLESGKLYAMARIEESEAEYNGRKIYGRRAHLDDNGLQFHIYLPGRYKSMTATLMDSIGAAFKDKKPYHVANYGKSGKQNMAMIHKPGEGKLKDFPKFVCM